MGRIHVPWQEQADRTAAYTSSRDATCVDCQAQAVKILVYSMYLIGDLVCSHHGVARLGKLRERAPEPAAKRWRKRKYAPVRDITVGHAEHASRLQWSVAKQRV